MNFGVLGTANVTGVVVPAIQATDHEVLAVASRERERAREAADDLGVPRTYGTHDALLDDDHRRAVRERRAE